MLKKFKLANNGKENCEQILANKKINPTAMRILTLDFLLKQSAEISLSNIENNFFQGADTWHSWKRKRFALSK